MVDQIIDRREVVIPGPAGDVTPEALQCQRASESARDQAESARDAAIAAGRVPDETVAGFIRDETSKVHAALHPRPVLVAIGDSYGSNPAASWAVELSKIMGAELHNYCTGGEGYISANMPFWKQVGRASADPAFDNARVDYVVVAGSRNDLTGQAGRLHTEAYNLFAGARKTFPTARILAVPLLWDYRPVGGYWHTNAAEVLHGAADAGAEPVPWAWTWLSGEDAYFTGTDIHPDVRGPRITAGYIAQAVRGCYSGRYEAATVKARRDTGIWTMEAVGSAGTISYSLTVNYDLSNSDQTPARLTQLSGLPRWAWPADDYTNGGRPWAMMPCSGGNDSVLFKVNPDGTFGWQGFTVKGATPNGPAAVSFSRPW